MSNIIQTSLGDFWELTEGYAKSENGLLYRLSEPMQRLIDGAQIVPGADPRVVGRMASRLREIENAERGPDGDTFLIKDRTLGGVWSHPVKFSNPLFDWNQRAQAKGTLFLLTKDPEIGIQSYVGDPQRNLQNPGSGDDVFNVVVWNEEYEEYGIAYQCDTFEHAAEYVLKGDLNKKLRALPPLPALGYRSVAFVDIPSAEHHGHLGMYAEVQLESQNLDGFRQQRCNVHLMDKFSRCVGAGLITVDELFDLRDRPKSYLEFLENFGVQEGGVHHNFRNSAVCEPEDVDDLKQVLADLKRGCLLKFQTPDDEYQMLITYEVVQTYRIEGTNKRLHTGPGAPTPEMVRDSGAQRIVFGEERAYQICVKHSAGGMIKKLSNVTLDAQKLYDLISDDQAESKMIEEVQLRPLNFMDNRITGDAPCYHQLLGASLQGKPSDVEYLFSRVFTAEELIKALLPDSPRKTEPEMSI